MYCPKCGKENPEGVRFCMHCGTDLSEYKVEISPKIEVSPTINIQLDSLADKLFSQGYEKESLEELIKKGPKEPLEPKTKNLIKIVEELAKEYGTSKKAMLEYLSGGLEYVDENYYDAIKCLTKAIKLDPNLGIAYLVRGLSYAKVGQYGMAYQDFRKAVELSEYLPDDTRALAYFFYGDAYRYIAAKQAKEIAVMSPSSDTIIKTSLEFRSKLLEVIQLFDKALEINPAFTEALKEREIILKLLKDAWGK